jgi:zinc protease
MQVLTVHVPGRPLVSANLLVRQGASDEPAPLAGVTILAARALTEGTARYPGVELIEASERLGATLHAEASWDVFAASVDVAAPRLRAALELLAELVLHPTFPEEDVARLRDERLNDLLQARAEPRRRVEQAFAASIYTADSPYSRSVAGDEESVPRLSRDRLVAIHQALLRPERAALIVGGDLSGLDLPRMASEVFGALGSVPGGRGDGNAVAAPRAESAIDRTIVRLHDRPGSVQSEVRIGHVGIPRRVPDFHAVQVMASILGGLFNSRLQMNLREDKGYTYGIGAGFDMRRGAGPFAVRTAVHTAATVRAISESLAELRRIRESRVTDAELAAARDYLVGVFPLRFETPGAVVAALGGLFAHGLPDDELARYRPLVEAVTAEDVQTAALEHIDPDRVAIVVVGDADAIASDLEAAGFGELEIVREEVSGDGSDSEVEVAE